MLSQRTVARFQRLLAALMQHEFYGLGRVLDAGLYYNALFEADIPRALLDTIGRRTYFNAVPLSLALYEGVAVAEARGSGPPSETDRQIGAAYLLCFMAVAVQFYDRLPWDRKATFEEYVTALLESLQSDGYRYAHGTIYEMVSGEEIRPIPLDSNTPRAVIPAKPAESPAVRESGLTRNIVNSDPAPNVDTGRNSVVRDAGWVGVFVAVIGIVVAIFNTEVHNWLKALWHRWLH